MTKDQTSYLAEAKGFQSFAFGNFFDSHQKHRLILNAQKLKIRSRIDQVTLEKSQC